MALHRPGKRIPLHSLAISLEDVTRIYQRLRRHVEEQAALEIGSLIKPAEKTDQEWQAELEEVRNRAFRITITISGDSGASLFGDDEALFSSPIRPQTISMIYMTNSTAYQTFTGQRPANTFELVLDFSKPPLLDSNNLVSAPTPNNSNLTVEGERDAWVASITDAVLGALQHRSTNRTLIHKAFVYDFGLMAMGLPLGVYISWKSSPFVTDYLGKVHPFISALAYVYIVLLTFWGYRILFGYAKWAFPTLELKDNADAARRHRTFWWAIVLGVLGSFLWDVTKAISIGP